MTKQIFNQDHPHHQRDSPVVLSLAEVLILGRDRKNFPGAWDRHPGDDDEIARRREIAKRFDPFAVFWDNPEYPDQPGTMRCCGRAVIQRNGVLCCDSCGTKIESTPGVLNA